MELPSPKTVQGLCLTKKKKQKQKVEPATQLFTIFTNYF